MGDSGTGVVCLMHWNEEISILQVHFCHPTSLFHQVLNHVEYLYLKVLLSYEPVQSLQIYYWPYTAKP